MPSTVVVGIEPVDQFEQLVLRRLGGNAVFEALHARFDASP